MKYNQHRKGIKSSSETKEKQRQAKLGSKNNFYGKTPKHGKRFWYNSPLQGQICFRSSYEYKYALYLDSNNILWYYEPKTFELSDEMTYTPDFFLPQFEKFIEIKGWMRPKAQLKIEKFQQEYPFELEVLQKKDLQKLGVI